MAENIYEGVIVADRDIGIRLRHFYFNPILNQELLEITQNITGSSAHSEKMGWSRVVIPSANHKTNEEIFHDTETAFKEVDETNVLIPVIGLDNPSWREMQRFLVTKSMEPQ